MIQFIAYIIYFHEVTIKNKVHKSFIHHCITSQDVAID